MKIKFILPALEEAKSPFWRPIKYSLFPPLGLATLASLCSEYDDIDIVDEHIENINLEDNPDLVCIQSYITNHILTPYPGTVVFENMKKTKRIITEDWRLYDTRHLVFKHPNITKEEMENGYKKAYKDFYKWGSIVKCSSEHEYLKMRIKHLTYAGAWKKFEPVWNFVIKNELLPKTRRFLEKTLK